MVYRSGGSEERPQNVFRNDGSFLEMFKKLQETRDAGPSTSSAAEKEGDSPAEEKPVIAKPPPFVGKRRGGRVLPTGKVKKAKLVKVEETNEGPKDAWSVYLEEVKRYKETTCEEDEKTRPLVK
ncbi:unnamed protein product [Nezara viridula]|uniref:Uncharacterized protein n=1 Tax=Nezara viridula TaxID=85310 RepID=A0A9P0MMB7_NEZVI|nr:unnamed protein product [Nezara viridula]